MGFFSKVYKFLISFYCKVYKFSMGFIVKYTNSFHNDTFYFEKFIKFKS